MDPVFLLVGAGSLICLVPLALYILYLAYLNNRQPPTLVPGSWDVGLLLLGLSGFLLLLGPVFLGIVDSAWRSRQYGNWAELRDLGRREAIAWSLMATGYLILLGTLLTSMVRFRRHVTAIYNVNARTVEGSLELALEELKLPFRRVGAQFEIDGRPPADGAPRSSINDTVTVRIDPHPTTGHAILRWDGHWALVRPQVEAGLSSALIPYAVGKSPVSAWLFTAAASIIVIVLLCLVVMIYIIATPPVN